MDFFALSMVFAGNVSADTRFIDPRIKAPAVVIAEAFALEFYRKGAWCGRFLGQACFFLFLQH